MKVGDYVRTKDYLDNQFVCKIDKIIDEYCINTDKSYWDNEHIIKSSPNIIDLIEIGDYVNGMKITNKFIDEETDNIELEFNNGSSYLYPKSWNYEARSKEYKIKSIVTKEQFSQMEYRIGE